MRSRRIFEGLNRIAVWPIAVGCGPDRTVLQIKYDSCIQMADLLGSCASCVHTVHAYVIRITAASF